MNEPSNLTVRNMSLEEFCVAMEWAAGEGWNPGLHGLSQYSLPRDVSIGTVIISPLLDPSAGQ
ncbi:MAG: hypothetical protein ABFD45_05720 [Smithella sp.]|jgi:hypothetical protein